MNSRGAKLVVSVALAGSLALVAGCSATSHKRMLHCQNRALASPR